MKPDTQRDEMLTRYLLDNMPEDEKQRVEEIFLQDDALFEEMLALENELMYEYKQGNLTPHEEKLFEQRFLATSQDKHKAMFADAFLKTIDSFEPKAEEAKTETIISPQPLLLQSFLSLFSFQSPVLQFGMAAAVLLLTIGGVWLFVQNAKMRGDLANLQNKQAEEQRRLEQQIEEKQKEKERLEGELSQEREQSQQDQKRIEELEEKRKQLEREIEEARKQSNQRKQQNQSPENRSIFAVLLPGGSRDGGEEMKTVELTKNVKTLALSLQLLRTGDYKSYAVTVKSVEEGGEILSRSNLKARGKYVSVQIPTRLLKNGDYKLTLSGLGVEGVKEKIEDYYFRAIEP